MSPGAVDHCSPGVYIVIVSREFTWLNMKETKLIICYWVYFCCKWSSTLSLLWHGVQNGEVKSAQFCPHNFAHELTALDDQALPPVNCNYTGLLAMLLMLMLLVLLLFHSRTIILFPCVSWKDTSVWERVQLIFGYFWPQANQPVAKWFYSSVAKSICPWYSSQGFYFYFWITFFLPVISLSSCLMYRADLSVRENSI